MNAMVVRSVLAVVAAVVLVSIVVAEWGQPGEAGWFDCLITGNMTCGDIQVIQCTQQGGAQGSTCFACTIAAPLHEKTCLPVEGGDGCDLNTDEKQCGLLESGYCSGTVCTGLFPNGNECAHVLGCDN